MVGEAHGVLGEGSVVIAVGVRSGSAEVLNVVVGNLVGVGAERGERKSSFHGLESEGIHFDFVEEVFAVLLAGKKIVDPGEERIAAEFEGMAEGLGKLGAMFARGAGKQVGTADAVHEVVDFDESVVGVGVGLAEVARKLGAEMTDDPR